MPFPQCGSTSTKYQRYQLTQIDQALNRLSLKGIGIETAGFRSIANYRTELLAKVGFQLPRATINIITLVGLSPGSLRLWFDIELGWMVEARAREGDPPVYRAVDDDTAAIILKGELTKEQEERLMTPDEYLGE